MCILLFLKKEKRKEEKPKVREMHLPTLLILKVQFRAHMVGLHLGQDTSGYS